MPRLRAGAREETAPPSSALCCSRDLLPAIRRSPRSIPSPPTARKTATLITGGAPGPAEDPGDAEPAGPRNTPGLTGRTLQAAQDAAQAAGFYGLTSSDATGAGRAQLLDRNWQVCFRTPAAGSRPTDTVVDLGTVKTEESCP